MTLHKNHPKNANDTRLSLVMAPGFKKTRKPKSVCNDPLACESIDFFARIVERFSKSLLKKNYTLVLDRWTRVCPIEGRTARSTGIVDYIAAMAREPILFCVRDDRIELFKSSTSMRLPILMLKKHDRHIVNMMISRHDFFFKQCTRSDFGTILLTDFKYNHILEEFFDRKMYTFAFCTRYLRACVDINFVSAKNELRQALVDVLQPDAEELNKTVIFWGKFEENSFRADAKTLDRFVSFQQILSILDMPIRMILKTKKSVVPQTLDTFESGKTVSEINAKK